MVMDISIGSTKSLRFHRLLSCFCVEPNNASNNGRYSEEHSLCRRQICLFQRNLGDAFVEDLAKKLVEERAHVEVLNLSKNHISDLGFSALARAFKSPKVFLHRAILGDNPCVGLAGMTALGESLKHSRIHAMSLTRCYIGNEECKALSKGLPENSYLRELLLHSNVIGDEGAMELGAALAKNSTLQLLDLSDNPIGERGIQGLKVGLQSNKSLQKLYLNDTRLSTTSMKFLVELLLSNTTLVALPTRTHSANDLPEQKLLMQQIEFYLRLNQSGRSFLRDDPLQQLLPDILSRVSNSQDILYGLCREVPHLLIA